MRGLRAAVTVASAEEDALRPGEREDLRALGVLLTGHPAAALGASALPGDPLAATQLVALLAHRRSSRLGDAASPGHG